MSEHDDRLVRRVVQAASGHDAAEACPDAEVLGLYGERGLAADEREAVEAHVATCARCQGAVATFVRSAPEAVEPDSGVAVGLDAGPRSWWSGWKWLVPAAATAAVITIAVWVQQPSAPGVAVVPDQAAPEAMRQAEAGRPEAAASPPAASGSAAPGRSEAQPSASAPGARRGQASPAPADLAKAESLMRAELAATAPAPAAAPAGARPADTLTDARERSVPETPAPATQAQLRVAESEAATAQRPAESREANRADAAAPARAKAVAGSEAAAPAGAAGLGAAGVRSAAQRPAQLTGRVTYRTRAALPAGAVIEVRLLDFSRMDAPAIVLGRVEIVTQGEQVPVPFVVGYDADAVDPRRRYTVQATITIEGRVAYSTTSAHTVLMSGGPASIEVNVEPLR